MNLKEQIYFSKGKKLGKKGGVTGSLGMFKFIAIALYAYLILNIVIGVARGVQTGVQTSNWTPLIDASLGQIVYWDMQIYYGIEFLKDDAFINTLPSGYQKNYTKFIINQITFNILLFVVFGFLLFKLGNWFLGIHSFSWHTDILVIGAIVVFFMMAEVGYGLLMHKEAVVPFRGLGQLFKGSTWDVLLANIDTDTSSDYDSFVVDLETFNNTTEVNS